MSAESLPAWVEVGADALLTFGYRDESVEKVTVTKITPSGQVVLNGQSKGERRFMLRDFQKDGTAHKYVGGTFSTGSLDLYPLDHPRVPLLIAKQEYRQAWTRVQQTMNRLTDVERQQGDSEQYVDALIERLGRWRRAKENLAAMS